MMFSMTYRLCSAAFLLSASFFVRQVYASENQCVVCHQKVSGKETSGPVHTFAEWQKSVHAKSGVACDACHGGDPAAKDKTRAHALVARSTMVGSRIYFDKIPETCGACHAKEFSGFKSSAHYKALQNSGRGPNCVTCHGSMAARVMTPRDMETLCSVCHRHPTQAYAALLALQNSRKSLDQLDQRIAHAKKENIDVAGQAEEFKKVQESYKEALQLWHTFDMGKVLAQAQNNNHRVRTALHELDLKQKIRK